VKHNELHATRRSLTVLLFCCFFLVGPGLGNGIVRKESLQPSVFLVTIDTLRADHVGCYGYERIKTPSLDHLAKDGTLFREAYTAAPITNTSHATILTGLLPNTHGVTDFLVPLSPAHKTWAELLKRQGYHTAAFIGAIVLDSRRMAPGFDRGFDFYDNFREQGTGSSTEVRRRGMDVVEHAEEWLKSNRQVPQFVWVHLYDAHALYKPPPPYSQQYEDRPYDGAIAYADAALGSFLSYLRQEGLYDKSIIIVVADHGEGLGEHGESMHGVFLYDSTIHVPLIVKLPHGEERGRVVDAQVGTVDILPTVLDLLAIPAPSGLDGESLKAYVTGREKNDRPIFSRSDYPLNFGWTPLQAVRYEGFKFIEAPRPELYDLHTDPGELKNIYEPWSATVQKCRRMLVGLRAKTSLASPERVVASETLAELQALGYWRATDSISTTTVSEPSLLPDPKDKVEELNLIETAELAGRDGRQIDARVALTKVLQMNPTSAPALMQLGQLEMRAGDRWKAEKYEELGRTVRESEAETIYQYAQARERDGDLTSARDALESSLNLFQDQLSARLLLGEIYLRLGDPNTAENQFNAVMKLQPGNAQAQLGTARSYLVSGNYEGAFRELQPLLNSDPSDPNVFDLLARTYSGLGRQDEARNAATRATQLRALDNKRGATLPN
jgi:choline-sulfatase